MSEINCDTINWGDDIDDVKTTAVGLVSSLSPITSKSTVVVRQPRGVLDDLSSLPCVRSEADGEHNTGGGKDGDEDKGGDIADEDDVDNDAEGDVSGNDVINRVVDISRSI